MEKYGTERLSREETAAVVMAAIAAYISDMSEETVDVDLLQNGLVVRSIRRHRKQR